jgi:hypothetical protein
MHIYNINIVCTGSKYVGLWRKGKMTGHGEIIHLNHKLVSKFKENHVNHYFVVLKFSDLIRKL